MFKCDKCGICCRNLDKSEIYKKLDRGDGVCIYLDKNICSIYEYRPLICRVDDCYDLYFSKEISREKYYIINEEACKKMKKESKKNNKN